MKNLSFAKFLELLNKESDLTNKSNYGIFYEMIKQKSVISKRELRQEVEFAIEECECRIGQYKGKLIEFTWFLGERRFVVKEYYERKLIHAKNVQNLISK